MFIRRKSHPTHSGDRHVESALYVSFTAADGPVAVVDSSNELLWIRDLIHFFDTSGIY